MRRVDPHPRPEQLHPSVFVADNATIRGNVTLDEDASVWFGAVLRGDVDAIAIGKRSNIQDLAVVHCDPGFPCTIGDEVTVGHSAVVHGATIASRVLIGIRAVVLNGATIGEGSIIGAGAVVTEGAVIPPNSLVVGVPGKVLRETSEEQRSHIVRNALNYVESGRKYKALNASEAG
jgi:carbonic anhydrase/acetyltransferase-like protein (isoleucine patch superfamily)